MKLKKKTLFLDILLICNNNIWYNNKILICNNNDIYLTDEYLKEELEHMRTVFHHRNHYPLWVINKVIDDAKKVPWADESDSSSHDKIHRLMLPYQSIRS